MALCTRAQVRERLGIAAADTDHDAVIDTIIAGVSSAMCGPEGACRPLELATRTHEIDVLDERTEMLMLPVWPVVSVTSVKEAMYGDFASATALVAATDYRLIASTGMLQRFGWWMVGHNTVQIVGCKAGYVSAGGVVGSGETALPAEIVEAAIKQVVHDFQARKTPGQSGKSVQGGSSSDDGATGLLPGVMAVLAGYRRYM
jgi:hypothetical protein